jgi:hypothetical protein
MIGENYLILFRALRCGKPEEDTEALNFTKMVAPEGMCIALGTNESPEKPMLILGERPRRFKADKG